MRRDGCRMGDSRLRGNDVMAAGHDVMGAGHDVIPVPLSVIPAKAGIWTRGTAASLDACAPTASPPTSGRGGGWSPLR